MQKWIFSPTSSLLTLLLQYTPTIHEPGPGGIDEGRGARKRGDQEEARERGGGEPSGELTGAANDCGFTRAALISWFTDDRLLHCNRG